MLVYILYNKNTEMERSVLDLESRLKRELVTTELLDADSPRGIQLAEHYDIMSRPAVMLVAEDGVPIQVWQGQENLPAPSDISYFAHQ
jgi:hypothetical protein